MSEMSENVANTPVAVSSPVVELAASPRGRVLVPVFVFTTLLSSCLLFLVQPLMARLTLPLLGGSPSVWAVTMCFFQAALLLGYGYSHMLTKAVPVRMGVLIHGLLMAIALLLLRFDVASVISSSADLPEGAKLGLALAATIGFPFAVMSANAPLLQRWFSHTHHKHADEPYFLYAASNLGSMSALILYPAVIEPFLGLTSQTMLWSVGFGLLVISLLLAGLLTSPKPTVSTIKADASDKPTWKLRGQWLVLAFLPSALLVAWTNQITTDIAAAPFLWLPPLALYLLSFIAAFRDVPWISETRLRMIQIVALTFSYIFAQGAHPILLIPILLMGAAGFAATAVLCHRQMYLSRPATEHLTTFYFIMSLGGVLGGLFVSLLAPVVFSSITEYPLLLVLALLLGPDVWNSKAISSEARNWSRNIAVFVIAAGASWMLGSVLGRPNLAGYGAIAVGVFTLATLVSARLEQKLLMSAFIVLLIVTAGITRPPVLFQDRNFFGVVTVRENDGYMLMYHGTTIHGAERLSDLAADARSKPQPLTYYAPGGGMGRMILATQARLAAEGRPGSYGIVGLGGGLTACYRNPGESWRFFEINNAVVQVARDPRFFNFIERCADQSPVILGDARLTLQKEAAASYDLLVIDAFSSDSIPVHLITAEALKLYTSLLKSDGAIAFHISNKHLELASVLAANLEAENATLATQGQPPLQARWIRRQLAVADTADTSSEVVVISRSPTTLHPLDGAPDTTPLKSTHGVSPWTDDYSNLLGAIWRRF